MKIIMISSEAAPFSRTGILGDTVAGLSKGLVSNGADVCIITPMYLTVCTNEEQYEHKTSVQVSAGGRDFTFEVFTIGFEGVTHIFLRNDELYGRRHIYGSGDFDYSDNDIRFGIFSMASLEYIRENVTEPDIIHCHEWSTGLVPVYRNLYYEDIKGKVIFSVNDISFQGIFSKFSLQNLGLPWDVYNVEELEYYEGISMLKGGIVHSDYVVVPSPAYCKDIQTEEHSQGLGLLMADISHKLSGILGGINYDVFNPAEDKLIPFTYDTENVNIKSKNKSEFLTQTDMKGSDKPLFLVETKFHDRKGLELIADSAETLAEMDANFAFFGYGDKHLCSRFKDFSNNYDNMYTFIGLSEIMVHLAYAAADFVLRPSLYEPSGNSHLKGMRYGALPVVSRTGGHIDAVDDFTDGGCGFFIADYSKNALHSQITRAVEFFKDKPILKECIKKVMEMDFSWKSASLRYLELYRRLAGGGNDS